MTDFIPIPQAEIEVNETYKTIRDWAINGVVDTKKVGGRRLVSRSSLLDWIQRYYNSNDYTLDEAAAVYGVPRDTIRYWLDHGFVEHYKLLRTVLVRRKSLDEYVAFTRSHLTRTQAACIAGVTHQAISYWIRTHKIGAIKRYGRWFISPRSLTDYLHERT